MTKYCLSNILGTVFNIDNAINKADEIMKFPPKERVDKLIESIKKIDKNLIPPVLIDEKGEKYIGKGDWENPCSFKDGLKFIGIYGNKIVLTGDVKSEFSDLYIDISSYEFYFSMIVYFTEPANSWTRANRCSSIYPEHEKKHYEMFLKSTLERLKGRKREIKVEEKDIIRKKERK